MNTQQVIHGPAQKVGNRRVSRKSFKKSVKQSGDTNKGEDYLSDLYHSDNEIESIQNEFIGIGDTGTITDEEDQADDEEEKVDELHIRELQDRHARKMQEHVASRQPNISNNPGNNAKQIFNSNPQHRGLNY